MKILNKKSYKEEKIYPVILTVPKKYSNYKGREKNIILSKLARGALKISAHRLGVKIDKPLKDKDGVPLPFNNGCYWSVTHKTEYVGGVLSSKRAGMDIEKIRPCSKALFKKTGNDNEWRLSDEDPFRLFFRYWTSKEAVLKANGKGLPDFSKCSVKQILDKNSLIINYNNKDWVIEHFFFDNHVASILKNSFNIKWEIDNGK